MTGIEYPELREQPRPSLTVELNDTGKAIWSDMVVDGVRLTWRELTERRTAEMKHYRDRAQQAEAALVEMKPESPYVPQLDDLVEFDFAIGNLVLARLQGINVAIAARGIYVQVQGNNILVPADWITPVEMAEEAAEGEPWVPSVGDDVELVFGSEAARQLDTCHARIVGGSSSGGLLAGYWAVARRDGRPFPCSCSEEHFSLFAAISEIAGPA